MAKQKKKGFIDIVIEFIPSIVLSLIICPLLGYFSYKMYSSTILGNSNQTFNLILFLIIIAFNLVVLLIIMYVANMLMKTDIKRHAITGGIILAFIIGMAIYRYTIMVGCEVSSDEWYKAFTDFRFARGILIGYVAYYVIIFFINKIAIVSLKNKKIKTSK